LTSKLPKSRQLDSRANVINANNKDVKLTIVLIKGHQLMAEEPPTLEEEEEEVEEAEEEEEDEDVEVKTELNSKGTAKTATNKATWNGTAGKRMKTQA
jgi:hypothetical protein